MKKTKTIPNKKVKFNIKEKIVTATFLSVVPKIIEIWKRETVNQNITFDEFLMNIYNKHKEDK